jgi:hypothetical protein
MWCSSFRRMASSMVPFRPGAKEFLGADDLEARLLEDLE